MTKIPRWAFEKFPDADPTLTTQMKSVGEDDGDRPDVQGVAAEGASRAGSRPLRPGLRPEGPVGHGAAAERWTRSRPSWRRPTPSGSGPSATPCTRACRVEQIHALTGHRPLVPGQHRRAGRARGTGSAQVRSLDAAGDALLARGQAERLLRPPARHALAHDRGGGPPRPPAPGHPRRLQAGRYLCRRVRGGHALLLFDLRE